MRLLVTLTWSKIMAFLMLGCAVALGSQAFMFTVPFVSALILGKQVTDAYSLKNKESVAPPAPANPPAEQEVSD